MSGKKNALAKLALSRRTGQRQSEQLTFEEKSLFKEMNDEEYAAYTAKMRREDIVEGADDLGYADNGEDLIDEDEYGDEEENDMQPSSTVHDDDDNMMGTNKKVGLGDLLKTNTSNKLADKKSVSASLSSATFQVVKESMTSSSSQKGNRQADYLDDMFKELDTLPTVVVATTKRTTTTASSATKPTKASKLSTTSSTSLSTDTLAISPTAEYNLSTTPLTALDSTNITDHIADLPLDAANDMAIDDDTNKKADRKRILPKKELKAAASTLTSSVPTVTPATALPTGVKVTPLEDTENAPTALSLTGGTTRPMVFDSLKGKDGKYTDSCLFYWLDGYEDAYKQPGKIYLFGKVMVNEKAIVEVLRDNAMIDLQIAQRAEKERKAAEKQASTTLSSDTTTLTSSTTNDDDESIMDSAPIRAKRIVPVPEFVSCCLTVHGNNRCCFVLPRETSTTGEPVEFLDVYNEVHNLMKNIIPTGSGKHLMKKVIRNYSFEIADVPRKPTEYLKLVYSAEFPALAADTTGKTIKHIFGTQTSCMEHFLLKRHLQGPCWLRITGARNNAHPASHCVHDIEVSDPKQVVVYGYRKPGVNQIEPRERAVVGEFKLPLPVPPLTVVGLSIKTVLGQKGKQHEIVMASLAFQKGISPDGGDNNNGNNNQGVQTVTIVCPQAGSVGITPESRAEIAASRTIKYAMDERALLNMLLLYIARMDPDVLVGHNIIGFDLDVLLHRMASNSTGSAPGGGKISDWSRIGRLRRTAMPRVGKGIGGKDQFTGVLAAGRLICDTYRAAQELVRETTYGLTHLSRALLDIDRKELEPVDVPRMLVSNKETFRFLCEHSAMDAQLALQLMFKLQVLPLTKQLTNLAGNLWSRSLLGSRAERIEYLLLHEFHSKKYILPDKPKLENKKIKDTFEDEENLNENNQDDDDDDNTKNKGKNRNAVVGTGNAARFAKGRNKPSYAGGLVLEPKKGLYDKYVLLLDFQSLYPSIIQEYNICFTTVDRQLQKPKTTKLLTNGTATTTPGKGTKGKGKKKATSSTKKGSSGTDANGDAHMDEEETTENKNEEANEEEDDDDEEETNTPEEFVIPAVPDPAKHPDQGVLPRVIAGLVMARRQVKAQAGVEKDPGRRMQLDIRQKALKILANSMYGCLGFAFSRFFAKPIAALVTSQGREILQSTVDMASNKLGLEVIYGDTDSVMIHTGSTDIKAVKEMGNRMKMEVNKLYKKLEIEIDGIFSMMLLLKKKKYAAIKVSEGPGGVLSHHKEVKGLDLVRRDWCVLSKRLGKAVLDIILSGHDREEVVDAIHKLLSTTASDLREGKVPLKEFIITKGLNKAPTDYPDAKGQPHLQVALARVKAGEPINVGDHIEFVICQEPVGTVQSASATNSPSGGNSPLAELPRSVSPTNAGTGSPQAPSSPTPTQHASPVGSSPGQAPGTNPTPVSQSRSTVGIAQRAYDPREIIRANGALHVDIEWYLTQQILPPIARLCEPIEGTSQARIADVLGLDAHRFNRSTHDNFNRDDELGFVPKHTLPDEERFRGTDPLMVTCLKCSTTVPFPGVYASVPGVDSKSTDKEILPVRSGLYCTKPGCNGLWGCKDNAPLSANTDAEIMKDYSSKRLLNMVIQNIRKHLLSLQQGWLVCEDGMCGTRTRNLSTRKAGYACLRPGCNSFMKPEKDASALHLQLEYYDALFNIPRAINKRKDMKLDAPIPRKNEERPPFPYQHKLIYDEIRNEIQRYLQENDYHYVQPSLFAYVTKINNLQNVRVKPLSFLPSNTNTNNNTLSRVSPGNKSMILSTPAPKGRSGSSLASMFSNSMGSTLKVKGGEADDSSNARNRYGSTMKGMNNNTSITFTGGLLAMNDD